MTMQIGTGRPLRVRAPKKPLDVRRVVMFTNGVTMVFDARGEQVPTLQEAWLRAWVEVARKKGLKLVDGMTIEMPGGRDVRISVTTDKIGRVLRWNWA